MAESLKVPTYLETNYEHNQLENESNAFLNWYVLSQLKAISDTSYPWFCRELN